MDIKQELARYKSIVDSQLKNYFKEREKEIGELDKLGVQTIKFIENIILSGGKRLRPALVYWGYAASGGKENKKIIEASLSIELTHIFLLIHDDIIDRDHKRHGVETIHERYKKISRKTFDRSNHEHVGNSFAIMAGDLANTLGNQIIINSKFNANLSLKATAELQKIISHVIVGEMRDIWTSFGEKATKKEILSIHKNKTASYTFEGPLHLGAILAGGNKALLDELSAYAIPVGVAFQVQDDILGVFGDEKKIGKPVASDLLEGKQTMLTLKALENGTITDKKFIRNRLGKADLTTREIERFKEIFKRAGALDYSLRLAKKLIREGKSKIEKSENIKSEEARTFLLGLADYLIGREL